MGPYTPLDGPQIHRTDQDVMGAVAPGDYNYAAIEKTVKGAGQVQSLTDTILPSIKALLTPSADNPTLQAIDRSTSRNVASAQTESMKRGLTGSDIEAGAMGMERQTGEMAKSSFFADSAGKLAGFMKELATGDINNQRENIIMMAQLMGQKLQSEQDIQMFREQLAANMEQAASNNKTALWGAGISALGSILSVGGGSGGSGAGAAGKGGGAAEGGAAVAASDVRLKKDIKRIGRDGNLDIFSFRWNDTAKSLGAHDDVVFGVMAQDVEKLYPDAVGEANGFKTVDYSKLPATVRESVNRLSAGV